MATMHTVVGAAISHADYMLEEYGEPSVVYHVKGPDKFGRADVFYVRRPSESAPYGGEVIYRTKEAPAAPNSVQPEDAQG